MTRVFLVASMLVFGVSAASRADGPTAPAPANSRAQQDTLRQAAQKACNDALDQDRFNYDDMDDCVSDTMRKLMRTTSK